MACISLFLAFRTCFESEREMKLHTVNFDVLLNFIRGYSLRDTFAKPRPACAVADCIVIGFFD